jgi:hypothetical protein
MRTVVTYLDKEKNRTTKEKAWTVMTQIFNDAGNLQRTGYSIGEAQRKETDTTADKDSNLLKLKDMDTEKIHVFNKPMVKAGRDESCDLVIDKKEAKKKIDKVHAVFELRQGSWHVIDRSKSGVWINGDRIPASIPRPIAPGDIIDLAQKQLYEVTEG